LTNKLYNFFWRPGTNPNGNCLPFRFYSLANQLNFRILF